jgi:hypothetical protein
MRLTACFQHNEKQGYPPEIFPELCSDMILQTAEALSSLSGRYTSSLLFKLLSFSIACIIAFRQIRGFSAHQLHWIFPSAL